MDKIKEQVIMEIMKVKGVDELNINGVNMVSEGFLDSLDIMNLIMRLEDTFEIQIDPEDVLSNNFEDVDAISGLVNKCRANK